MGGGQLLGGLLGIGVGASQKRQGNRMLKKNPHLDYEIPAEAINAASEGLPAQQYANAMKNIQAQQAAAISAAADRRSALGVIGKTQAMTNNAVGALDAQDAAARMQNQRILGQYRDKGWNVKNQQRESDRAYAYGLMGAGNTNLFGGIDKGIAGLGGIGYGLFGNGGGRKPGGSGPSADAGYYNQYDPSIGGYHDF